MICPPRERHNENISAVGGISAAERKTGLIASGEERKRPKIPHPFREVDEVEVIKKRGMNETQEDNPLVSEGVG